MFKYLTVLREAEVEQVIERSRFIAHVKPVDNREEAESFIAEIRARNKAASHNVPAMVIGDKFQTQWASDDGEPQGTAGAPIVQMLVKEGITNVAVVVTRYYGGINLGKGGLVRAYTGSAKLGVFGAGICRVNEMSAITINLDYSFLSKVQSLSKVERFEIRDVSYSDAVTMMIEAKPEDTSHVKSVLADISAGTCKVLSESAMLVKTPVE